MSTEGATGAEFLMHGQQMERQQKKTIKKSYERIRNELRRRSCILRLILTWHQTLKIDIMIRKVAE